MNHIKESIITIQLVHGGFIFNAEDQDGYKTEVFTSQGKLMKAIRTAIESNSLISKSKDDGIDTEAAPE